MIYLDNAATRDMSVAALNELTHVARSWRGNPSSVHADGVAAKEKLERARHLVAEIFGVDAGGVYFTSGGTEADNLAINSLANTGALLSKRHIITTPIEHHAVLNPIRELAERSGFEVSYLNVGKTGIVDPSDVGKTGIVDPSEVADLIRDDTAFVSVMYVNNEVGTVQPISEIGKICKEHGVPFFVDAVQAVGKVPINMKYLNADLISISAHKFGGPPGVGALICSPDSAYALWPMMQGGGQEMGLRPGTENLPGICSMAVALEEASLLEENRPTQNVRTWELWCLLDEELSRIPGVHVNGDALPRTGIYNVSFDDVEAQTAVLMLSDLGLCVSAGAACSTGSPEPSHVLKALGLSDERAYGGIRISIGEYNTRSDIEQAVRMIEKVVSDLREARKNGQAAD